MCGKGTQKRTRECTTNNKLDCDGQVEEINTCFGTNCTTGKVYNVKAYLFEQFLKCLYLEEHVNELFLSSGQTLVFTTTHLISIGILAFLLGSLTILCKFNVNDVHTNELLLLNISCFLKA